MKVQFLCGLLVRTFTSQKRAVCQGVFSLKSTLRYELRYRSGFLVIVPRNNGLAPSPPLDGYKTGFRDIAELGKARTLGVRDRRFKSGYPY